MILRLALCATLLPLAARACAVAEPFAVADIAGWPVVVMGEVAAYARDATGEGHISLEVSEVLKGEAPARIEARWPVQMAEFPPDRWDRPGQVLAAFLPSENGPDLVLAVEICGRAMLAEASAANLAEVRAALGP